MPSLLWIIGLLAAGYYIAPRIVAIAYGLLGKGQ